MAKVIILGPAYPLRGGLAAFNQRLAKEYLDLGHYCKIYSFSLQYPSFLFPGKTQFSDEPKPEGLEIKTVINSVKQLNRLKVGRQLKAEQADLVIVRYWMPFMAPALGTILRCVDKRRTKVLALVDNMVPHEKRPGDTLLSRYFVPVADAFVTMSDKVASDVQSFNKKSKPVMVLQHPLYDNFGEKMAQETAKQFLGLPLDQPIVLFFGFIRKYKGLDLLLDAFALFKQQFPEQRHRLLIAGEFYEDEQGYLDQIETLGIKEHLILKTSFISDSEVKYYLSAADVLVQPYKNATQSGVTPLAYHFELPMVVTNVGGLPELVPHNECGIVVAPDASSLAEGIALYYKKGRAHFEPGIIKAKEKFSWTNFAQAFLKY